MTVVEYLFRDIEKQYDDYTISVQDEEGNNLYYGDKYDVILVDELDKFEVLKVEENKNDKYLIFMV